jgi:RNA polymerase sigma-70 factor (ECF subfamily)
VAGQAGDRLLLWRGRKPMQAGVILGNLASAIGGVRPEEATILLELKAGSEEAFASLIAQYHQPIYSLVARMVQNPSDAPDLTQEIFIKVFRGIRGFKGDSSLRTWMYRIAVHEASNQRRWWKRHCGREVALDAEMPGLGGTGSGDGEGFSLLDTLATGDDSPFDQAAQAQLRERIEAELRAVGEPYRTTLVLRDIEGFTYEEIAEILGVQLGTVKSRLMRGRACLKARLAPYMESRMQVGRSAGSAAGSASVSASGSRPVTRAGAMAGRASGGATGGMGERDGQRDGLRDGLRDGKRATADIAGGPGETQSGGGAA